MQRQGMQLQLYGVFTCSHDVANRLTSAANGSSAGAYGYTGLGDRITPTVNGATTNYTLDIAAGLTQVLSDSTRLYLYGPSTGSGHAGRIAQHSVTGTDYFLGDALGSVRQLADGRGEVTLARSYAPYGEVMSSSGEGTTSYDFAGETRDYTGLIYLRARYISTAQGRFLSRDTWPPDHRQPMSLNAWLYAYANPVMYTDPTGNVTRDYCESISDPTARQACHSIWRYCGTVIAECLLCAYDGHISVFSEQRSPRRLDGKLHKMPVDSTAGFSLALDWQAGSICLLHSQRREVFR